MTEQMRGKSFTVLLVEDSDDDTGLYETANGTRTARVHRSCHLTRLGLRTAAAALMAVLLQAQPGSLDPTFIQNFNGVEYVSGIAQQSDGKWVVGCSYIGWGPGQGCVARLHPGGRQDGAFKTGFGPADSWISTVLVLPDDRIVVGGAFTEYNRVARSSLARLLPNGDLDATFEPRVSFEGREGNVRDALLQPDNKLLIVGFFTSVNGVGRTNLARLHSNGSLDEQFVPELPVAGQVERVFAQSDGKILINGSFTEISGRPRNRLARLNSDGSLDETFEFNLHAYDWFQSLTQQHDGRILLGGRFVNRIGQSFAEAGAPWALTMRLNVDGSLDESFIPALNNHDTAQCGGGTDRVHGLLVQPGGKIVIYGSFSTLNGLPVRNIARLNPDGTLDGNFDPGSGPDGGISRAVPDEEGRLILLGCFTNYNNQPVSLLAKINAGEPAPGAPLFKGKPAPWVLDTGHTVVLTDLVSAFPLATFQWQLNGQHLPGATRPELVLTNLNPTFAGEYRLVASNLLGVAIGEPVTLLPPTLLVQPSPQTEKQGLSASFSVIATNMLPLSYQWQFEGADLPGETNNSLSLSHILAADAGTYTVAISNTVGAVSSAPAVLTVVPPNAPEILLHPQGLVVEEGVEVSFSVLATNYLPLSYQWQFNAAAIPGATQSVLTLPQVELTNSGAYTVRVSSEFLFTLSEPASLVVNPVTFVPGPGVVTNRDQASLEMAVASGVPVTFGLNGVITLTSTLVITDDVTLDGTGRSVTLDGQNALRHFVVNEGAALRLINMTLANGRFVGTSGETNQPGAPAFGGSVYSSGGTIELLGCKFIGNSVLGGDGGPMVCFNCIFSSTLGAPGYGGAIYVTNAVLRAADCTFSGNSAEGGRGRPEGIYTAPGADAFGGAIYSTASVTEISGVTFTNNWVQAGELWGTRAERGGGKSYGGALADRNGTTILSDSVFVGNQARGASSVGTFNPDAGRANGGAAFHDGGTMRIEQCLFLRNTSTGGHGTSRGMMASYAATGCGGAVFNQSGILEIRESALLSNAATGGPGYESSFYDWFYPGDGFGGAIFNQDQLSVINSTFGENTANGGTRGGYYPKRGQAAGGAIYTPRGKVSLLNVTLAGNLVQAGVLEPPTGSGSSIATTGASTITLTNSILSCGPGQTNVSGKVADGGNNICSDASADFTLPSSRNLTDPLLGTLQQPAGPTSLFPLLGGSPAIDAGNDAAAPAIDQRGVGRPCGLHADIGAYERVVEEPLRFTSSPASATAGMGETVALWAAVNTDMAFYQWLFNGTPLPGATNLVFILHHLDLSHSGDYVLEVRNGSGSVRSEPATLTVLPPTPPTILAQPHSQTIPEGAFVELFVTATNLLPISYQWQHNGTNLPGATRRLLKLEQASQTDAGTYQVIVSTEFLSTTSLVAVLTVGSSSLPSVVIEPPEVQTQEGAATNFVAVASGASPFTYQWQYEGIDLPGATNATITLTNLSVTRAGYYTVKVSNSLGEATSKEALLAVAPSMLDLNFVPAPAHLLSTFGLQQDGSIILSSEFLTPSRHLLMGLVRLTPFGRVDPQFQGSPTNVSIGSFVVQPDDKIVIGGYILTNTAGAEPYLARLNADGSFDSDFQPEGPVPWSPGIVLQPDGKILLVSFTSSQISRLNADGTRDASFVAPDLGQSGALGPILVEPDRKLLIAQSNNLLRFDAQGQRDNAYSVTFKRDPFASGSAVRALARQPDGKILAGGNFYSANETIVTNLVRLNQDGSLDTTFHPAWTGSSASTYQAITALAVNTAGMILVGGAIPGGVMRLNEDGSLDMNFQVGIHQSQESVTSMASANDGSIVIRIAKETWPSHVRLARVFDPTSASRVVDWFRLGPMLRLAVTTRLDSPYTLEATDSLERPEWTPLQTRPGNGTKQVLVDVNASMSQRFYRVRKQ